ncbi:MAG: OmpA family protein, partial [bacterium]|nr:OmpA family protein [bacterium]
MRKAFFLLLIIVITAGCVSSGKYKIKTDEAIKYQAQSQDLNAKVDRLEKTIAEQDGTNKKLSEALSATSNSKDKMISDLTQEKKALQDMVNKLNKEKEDSISSLKKTYDSLMQDMQSEIKNGEIQITQLKDKLTVNMVDRILFNSGQAEVNKQGQNTLEKVGAILKSIKDKQFRIEGHTDNIPISRELKTKYETNWELSASRATHVARYLIEKTGLDPKLVAITGYA